VKEKPNEIQVAHFVPRKRKGLNAKDSPATELQSVVLQGSKNKQLVQFGSQAPQVEVDVEI
jgi:hypothetical protein